MTKTKQTTYGLVAFIALSLVIVWLDWAGHDKAMGLISNAMTVGIVLYALYQWSVWNLAKARARNDELK